MFSSSFASISMNSCSNSGQRNALNYSLYNLDFSNYEAVFFNTNSAALAWLDCFDA
jgi:hypothetical protein